MSSWRVSIQKNSPSNNKKAALVLADGTFFVGRGFGKPAKTSGEVVFSTSMVGYPEALTDPSYKGQILTLTYPLVGNYGVPQNDIASGLPLYFESARIQPSGLVIHELCTAPHHWASSRTLDQWLMDEGIPGISGVDTRRLTKKLRIHGVMLGIIQVVDEDEELKIDSLLEEAKRIPDPNLTDLVKGVSVEEPVTYKVEGDKTIALVDCGVKNSIIRNFLTRGINVIRVPYDFSAKEILEYNPRGIVVSNGPGDPKKCETAISTTRELVETVPVMGICLGNQILTLAMGGDTYKMKFGHRAQNQPALDLNSNRCYITTQNHGYAVDLNCFEKTPLKCWFINANDKTVEGVKHKTKPVFAVQWHPEASPGPYDTGFLFDEFSRLLEAS
jgi:carbamoyl-phosphate synthase small subunit